MSAWGLCLAGPGLSGGAVMNRRWARQIGSFLALFAVLLAAAAWSLLLMGRAPARLYIACTGQNRVALVDPVRHEVLGHLQTDAGPEELLVGGGGWRLYVACREAGTVQVFDTATRRLLTRYIIGRAPGNLSLDEERGILEVANVEQGPNTLLHLQPDPLLSFVPRTVTSPVVGLIEREPRRFKGEVDARIGSQVELEDRGVFLGVASEIPDVLVAGIQDQVLRLRIPIGLGPSEILSGPGKTRAFISLRGENAVAVLDLQTLDVLARLPVGQGPTRLLALPGEEFLYVMNTEGSTVSVIRMEGPEVCKTLEVGGNPLGAVLWNLAWR